MLWKEIFSLFFKLALIVIFIYITIEVGRGPCWVAGGRKKKEEESEENDEDN